MTKSANYIILILMVFLLLS